MVEVKGPKINLDENHRDQGLSYARLLREMPPYTIVSNGTDFKVYDTITTNLLESGSPEEASWWKNGSSFEGIQLPDQSTTAKKLVELDFNIFKEFSIQQTNIGLADLRGDPFEGYRYSPDIFLERKSVTDALIEFEQSNQVCFGIYGDSGFGKTATLCHLVEGLNKSDSLALFYRGTRIWKGLSDAIRNDFLWEFNAESSISDIIKRLDALAITHNKKIYIFIDGLDEFPGIIENLKAELIDFLQRLIETNLRLVLTCKSHDWVNLIRDRGITLNSFGRGIFPSSSKSQSPGYHLQGFQDIELDNAWLLYSQTYSITGSLEGETREVARTPLMLRFIAETYKNSTPPSDLSDVEIFQNYWNQKMNDFAPPQQQAMEVIISKASQLMIEMDQEAIEESILFSMLDPAFSQSDAYDDLFRFHFLLRIIGENNRPLITFPFRKLRAFTYSVISQKWNQIRSPAEVIAATNSALSTREGRYALFFFLSIIDSGTENWLAILVQNDFHLFLKVYREVFSGSHKNLRLTDVKLQEEFGERSERFIESYSYIRNDFEPLRTKLTPFTKGDAGIYEIGGWFGFRTRTEKYPHAIVSLDADAYRLIRAGEPQITLDILPERSVISNTLPGDLRTKIPEILAWEELNKQIAEIFENQLLDESQSPAILNERIHFLLSEAPNIGLEGSPRGYYWELLGYETLIEAQNAKCHELLEKTNNLTDNWVENIKAVEDNPPLQRWYQLQLPNLFVLSYLLDSFKIFSDTLLSSGPELEALFSYLSDSSLENVSRIAIEQLEDVMSSYCSLLETNFPHLVDEFSFYKYRESQILIEISRDSGTPWKSDYLHLSYVFLPSVKKGEAIIREIELDESIAEKFISWHRSAGNIFGIDIPVETMINGTMVIEKNALISRTGFPSHKPISDQAYQLIANEAEYLFGGRMKWMNAKSGRFNSSKLAEVIRMRQIFSKIGY